MIQKVSKLTASKQNETKEELLNSDFVLPTSQNNLERAQSACATDKEVMLTNITHELKNENKSLKRKLASQEDLTDSYNQKLEEFHQYN